MYVMPSCVPVVVLTDDASALTYCIQSMALARVQNIAYAPQRIH